MKRKEKDKRKFLAKKRIIFSLVFVCLSVLFFNFQFASKNSHSLVLEKNEVHAQMAPNINVPGYTNLAAQQAQNMATNSGVQPSSDGGLGIIGGAILGVVNAVLYVVFQFFGLLLALAGSLFDWVINPNNLTNVLNMKAIYNSWMVVRDFLNLFFVFVLLFSAFCTVFGVQKYHIKKIILMVIIMALLVNFSFPIARFIIDIGNILMYFFVNKAFPGLSNGSASLSAELAQFSGIQTMIDPGYANHSGTELTMRLVASNIFLFILAMTLLIIAMIMLIRIVVLAILIIFAPIGFVAEIFPNFSRFASSWWSALFKQTFIGPIMVFVLYLALSMMQEVQSSNLYPTVQGIGKDNFSTILTGGLQLAIPLAILWTGIIVAQRGGAAGAGAALKYARKGMNWAAMAPLHYSGVEGGTKKAWEHFKQTGEIRGRKIGIGNLRYGGKNALEEREAKLGSAISGSKDYANLMAKRVKEAAEKNDTTDMTERNLRELANSGNQVERAAAVQELANRSKATQAEFDNVRNAFGETSQVFRQLQNKVKDYDPSIAFSHITDDLERNDAIHEYITSNKFDQGKLSAHALGNSELMGAMIGAGVIDNDALEKHRKKSLVHADNIKSSLGALVVNAQLPDSRTHQNIQMAYTSQVGALSAVALGSAAWQTYIAQNADKDTFKRFDGAHIAQAQTAIAQYANSGKIKDIISNMQNSDAKRNLTRYIYTTSSMGGNHDTLRGVIDRDNYLRGLV